MRGWRKTRRGGAEIPEELWDQAAALAREQGVNRIARALRLDYNKLKRRAARVVPGESAASPPCAPSFVEWKVPPGLTAECVIELENPGGRMKVDLQKQAGVDWEGLLRGFWLGRRP